MAVNKRTKRPVGNAAFRKAWQHVTRHHRDDWSVNCAYDFEGWRIWQAAIRYERARRKAT